MNELDGENRLVFSGPFVCYFSDGKKVIITNVVIGSKEGEVAEIPVSQLRTVKDIVLDMLFELAKEQRTIPMIEHQLQGGAVPIGSGLFWLKPETEVSIAQKEEEEIKTIRELRELAKKI